MVVFYGYPVWLLKAWGKREICDLEGNPFMIVGSNDFLNVFFLVRISQKPNRTHVFLFDLKSWIHAERLVSEQCDDSFYFSSYFQLLNRFLYFIVIRIGDETNSLFGYSQIWVLLDQFDRTSCSFFWYINILRVYSPHLCYFFSLGLYDL